MKTVTPATYPLFSCIADKCTHTCCAGWEIDVDEDTLAKYKSLPPEIGKRILANIESDNEGAHFRLLKDERCPFLTGNGLCDLIVLSGDDELLCDICRDHPRYRFYFSSRTETGLGLCCEEACRIALSDQKKFSLIALEDDGEESAPDPYEEDFFDLRNALFDRICDRAMNVGKRVCALQKEYASSLNASSGTLLSLFLSLEHLDESWPEKLKTLNVIPECEACVFPSHLEIPMEQLLCHLIFRNLSPCVDDDLLNERIALCIILWRLASALVIKTIAEKGNCSFEELVDIVRLLSSEIEYSDQNIDRILEFLTENI